jgi:hypothetical protein
VKTRPNLAYFLFLKINIPFLTSSKIVFTQIIFKSNSFDHTRRTGVTGRLCASYAFARQSRYGGDD